ncbi:hypothetical protein JZ751_008116, partial [Albula glossodonta]
MALCLLCESHNHDPTHKVITVEKAVSDLKERIRGSLIPMRDQHLKCKKFKVERDKIVQCR